MLLTRELLGVRLGQYRYMASLSKLANSSHSYPPPHNVSWPVCQTPVQVPVLANYLRYHPAKDFVTFILFGLATGFRIGFGSHPSGPLQSARRNHPSVSECTQAVSQYIGEECVGGRMVGPVLTGVSSQVHCSPIGLVPKGRDSGRWRMIVDLSHPHGRSVNDGIDSELCSLQYASVDDAVRFLLTLGQGSSLIKVDLKSAYRIVPVHPRDRHLLGIQWEGKVYVDMALSFGLRSAPLLFTAVADAIGWALTEAGVPLLLHYLDDFLFFVPPMNRRPDQVLSHILSILHHLGVPVAPEKIEGPATVVTFLGIVVDTDRFEIRLPEAKLAHIRELVSGWRGKHSGRYKDLESLLGHLSHAATVIRDGRIFLRHLFSILAASRSQHHFVHLNKSAQADLSWWACFLHHWNGHSFFPRLDAPTTHVYTDASGSFGCSGILMPQHWFQIQWPEAWAGIDISVKELVPIVVAGALCGRAWAARRVFFHCDNMAVVAILRGRSARDPLALHLLRCFYFYASLYKFHHCVEHIPGMLNVAADSLSRDNVAMFSSLVPQATPTRVAQAVMEFLVTIRPDWGSRTWIASFANTLTSH